MRYRTWDPNTDGMEGVPDYLRRQYTQYQADDNGTLRWGNQNGVLRDSQGRAVIRVNADGSSPYNGEKPKDPSQMWEDPDLGPVVSADNWDGSERQRQMRMRRNIAFSTMAALGAAGAGGFLPGTESAGAVSGSLPGIEPSWVHGATLDAAPTFGGVSSGVASGLPAGATGALEGYGAGAVSGGAPAGLGGALEGYGAASGGGLSGLGSAIRGGVSSITSALGGPSNALRAGLGLASLVSGTRGGSGGGGGGGGAGDFNDLLAAQANANRYDINSPTGSRRWTQGEDGRWTMTDAMSPEEQANYESVRGMNADSTAMARARLAALMSSPSRQRADAPLTGFLGM